MTSTLRNLLTVLCCCLAIGVMGQAGSEIYLFDIREKGKTLVISNPRNITNHAGYDNQPSFHPTKPILYYASFDENGRAELKQYDLTAGTTLNVTKTQEREYSPTVTPDGNYVSCIIQRDNNAQDLGKYPIDGGTPEVLVGDLVVGYHAWLNNQELLLFVLGDPVTLRHYDLQAKANAILAENVGRSIHRIPGEDAISFVHKVSLNDWQIKRVDGKTKLITKIGSTLPGREDICWLPDGRILSSDGTDFFLYAPGKNATWTKIEMKDTWKGISRVAVDKKGTRLAVVVSE